jgi:lipopolysaccharide export system permease protein
LFLSRGNIQRVNPKTREVEIVRFNRTAVNLGELNRNPADFQLEMTERYVGELLHPDLSQSYDRDNAALLIGEGHARIAAPLYAFAYVLIAVYALIGGPYDRRRYAIRIAAACAAVGGLRVAGFILQGEASELQRYWIIYAAPLAAIAAASILVADLIPRVGAATREARP